jgi:hypothetical protein
MMTERLRLLDCVPRGVRDNQRYAGDHVIRHYRPLGLAALLRDLGADPSLPDFEIIGGIGRLVLRADGSEVWEPNAPGTPQPSAPPPRPADPALESARRAICSACDSMRPTGCSSAGCGCTGEARPAIWSSRCPQQRWPTPPFDSLTILAPSATDAGSANRP